MESFHIGAMASFWKDGAITRRLSNCPELHTQRGRERGRKLESINRESTHNLHRQHINLSSSCDHLREDLSETRQRKKSVRNRTLSNPGQKTFQMVHGAWRDSMTALFKILWRMKHTV